MGSILESFLKRKANSKPHKAFEEEAAIIPSGPQRLQDFIGQSKVKEPLEIATVAALREHRPLDHILLFGPGGFGKTQLARILAKETGATLIVHTPATFTNVQALNTVIKQVELEPLRCIVFIDEIHALKKNVQEALYEVMQDFTLRGKPVRRFAVVGATTDAGLLREPFRDRFRYKLQIEPYDAEDLEKIIRLHYDNIPIEVANFLAKRARGAPRRALNLAIQTQNAATYSKSDIELIHAELVAFHLKMDDLGLDDMDRRILNLLADAQKPIGAKTICYSLNISTSEFSDMREPYLLRLGFIIVTPRGRELTSTGLKYLRENANEKI